MVGAAAWWPRWVPVETCGSLSWGDDMRHTPRSCDSWADLIPIKRGWVNLASCYMIMPDPSMMIEPAWTVVRIGAPPLSRGQAMGKPAPSIIARISSLSVDLGFQASSYLEGAGRGRSTSSGRGRSPSHTVAAPGCLKSMPSARLLCACLIGDTPT